MLQPNSANKTFQARTRAKAKMYEYDVPIEQHINLQGITLTDLLDLTIGMLGTLAANTTVGDMKEEKYRLLFSAQYFLALIEGQSAASHVELIRLLAAAGFFLADYPGSSQVILKDLDTRDFSELELFLAAVLKREEYVSTGLVTEEVFLSDLSDGWNRLIRGLSTFAELNELSSAARDFIYQTGGDEDLLLIDLIRAIILKRSSISSREILSEHSDADMEMWDNYFTRTESIKEFWPSQVRLAERGVFEGTSAIVQMPTSAGKTRATEFIIRSCFLSSRGTLAVVVAPFRALCQEVYNDFSRNFANDRDIDLGLVSDVLQDDLEIEVDGRKSILILTPEKLDFLLRYRPEITNQIGLIVYDEGHLFDDSSRGIKYELLLSSLRAKLPVSTQVVLISAVISNAQEVKDWLLEESGVLVDGKDLSPTNRNIAFVDWTQRSRNLQFVDESNTNQTLFFVPSVLQSHELAKRQRERVRRFYPSSDRFGRYVPTQIAGFLGCRLASGGLSAVFTGRKDSAQKIATEIVDAYGRGLPIRHPSEFTADLSEVQKVITYIGATLGEDSINAQAAALGILMHHSNIPHGLRLVTECALQESHFKMVICTSTLAQGVNLPIRYLIISTDRQGREKIKTRDFHNLMGRAGRSGKYTEGTVIFADPDIYRSRGTGTGSRWSAVAELLNPDNSEPSKSRLLRLLEDANTFDEDARGEWDFQTREIRREIYSYLITALAEVEDVQEMERIVTELARGTLGYSQISSDEEKTRLIGIFIEIGSEILTAVPILEMRPVFSRSILNLQQSGEVIELLNANLEQLIEHDADLINILWPILYQYNSNPLLASFSEEDSLVLCRNWIAGNNFLALLEQSQEIIRINGNTTHLNHIIELCEGGFSYAISTLLSSITELCSLVISEEHLPRVTLELLRIQKQLRYGVPSEFQADLYELGFSDRRLVAEITAALGGIEGSLFRRDLVALVRNSDAIKEIIDRYPLYFRNRLNYLS